jgi:hypothetical protein
VGLDAAAVGKELAGVLKYDHAIAEKTPALLWVAGDDPGGVMVGGVGGRTGGLVLAHCVVSSVGVALVTLTKGAHYSSERLRYEQVTPVRTHNRPFG